MTPLCFVLKSGLAGGLRFVVSHPEKGGCKNTGENDLRVMYLPIVKATAVALEEAAWKDFGTQSVLFALGAAPCRSARP